MTQKPVEKNRITRLPTVLTGGSNSMLLSDPIWIQATTARKLPVLVLLIASCTLAIAAQESAKPAAAQNGSASTIKSESKLILVRVVVRDAKGKAVAGLGKGDFQVFDNKREQTISYFSTEAPRTTAAIDATASTNEPKKSAETIAEAAKPQRFTAIFFDDYHLQPGDLTQVRAAAKRYLTKSLADDVRVAIRSATGNVSVDFTSDRVTLEHALAQLRFESHYHESCPDLTDYQAQLVDDRLDTDALQVAESIVLACHCNNDPRRCPDLLQFTQLQASRIVNLSDEVAANTLTALDDLVRQMQGAPGERTIAMVSDGFLDKKTQLRMDALIDHALRANVTINAMDARGLFAMPPGGNLAGLPINLTPRLESIYENMLRMGMQVDGDALNEASEGTGGIFVENTNDFEGGMGRISSLHETSYVLGFSPENFKFDGNFHDVSVKLVHSANLTVQARRGYFAPKQAEDAATATKDEMKQALFSRENLNGLPIQISTKIVKLDPQKSKITVTVQADMHTVHFRKEDGNNVDDLTLMVALFDQNGKLVAGKNQTINLRLPDAALAQLRDEGGETTADLDATPGNYSVRAVMRESASRQLGAVSKDVVVQ
jgi:VWFA-related protein